ncbi:hypothetical protein JXO52_05350 [bacterium]|nr:hypothetical protein [bacterium]
MESLNIKEYELIQSVLTNLKNCITAYLGFVLGGSSAAFFLYANLGKDSPHRLYLSMLMSIVLTLILLMLYYKFNSHNRYAGYCKLLNQEFLTIKNKNLKVINQLMAWEISMDMLQREEMQRRNDGSLIAESARLAVNNSRHDKEVGIIFLKAQDLLKEYRQLNCIVFFWKGIQCIYRALRQKNIGNSWHFPPVVTSVFVVLNSIYIALCVKWIIENSEIYHNFLLYIVCYLFFLVIMWPSFINRLGRLMEGDMTVDAYCWKFLPIRFCFLNRVYPGVKYKIHHSEFLFKKM